MDNRRALQALRAQLGKWSQPRLAHEVGVSASTMARWEQGVFQPSPANYKRLAGLAAGSELHEYFLSRAGVDVPPAHHSALDELREAVNNLREQLINFQTRVESKLQAHDAALGFFESQATRGVPGVDSQRENTIEELLAPPVDGVLRRLEARIAGLEQRIAEGTGTAPPRAKRTPNRIVKFRNRTRGGLVG